MSEDVKIKGLDPQEAFLNFFKLEFNRERLAKLSIEGTASLGFNFEELVSYNTDLAELLIANPTEMLEHAKNAAYEQLKIEDPEYAEKLKEVKIQVYDLFDTTPLRKIGAEHIKKLIMVRGVIVKATVVKPKVLKAAFECNRCGERQYVEQTTDFLKKPLICINPTCKRKGPFTFVEDESTFINIQELWVQEAPEELPPGQLPRSLHVKALEELVNIARPGDNVSIVGIVRSKPRKIKGGKLSTFDLFLEANSIKILGKEPEAIPDINEINRIIELSKDPWIHRKIINSIAPSIYGYEHIKEAIMYLLFGGVPKELEDIKIRGELNILLVGDPSTAKSQLLRYVAKLAPRGLYTSGRGVSGVGLTATCVRDAEAGGEWTLVAGALVLADKGVLCVDEIDKMNEADRQNIHEPLEQHTISVAKGGIVATLNARTAVLAAANPVLGRYNPYATIVENIALPIPLLSRFDLIFLMLDVPNIEIDTKLSKHILKIHGGQTVEPPIPLTLLRKYITYAKQIKPTLTQEAIERLQKFYLELRKKSINSSLAIGPRQLEALTRITEARARAALRQQATAEDAEAAIRIMTQSLQQVGVDITGKPDIDIIMTGKPKSLRDKSAVIIKLIVEAEKETGLVDEAWLVKELKDTYGISESDTQKILNQLLREGVIYHPRDGFIKKT